jgi:hypothetical protein
MCCASVLGSFSRFSFSRFFVLPEIQPAEMRTQQCAVCCVCAVLCGLRIVGGIVQLRSAAGVIRSKIPFRPTRGGLAGSITMPSMFNCAVANMLQQRDTNRKGGVGPGEADLHGTPRMGTSEPRRSEVMVVGQ